ncbi:MAG: YfiR family protein [Thauera sp.]
MSIFNIAFPALRTLALGLLAAATLGAADARADDALDQARLKAAFVLNFMKFTTWPEARTPDAATLTLCATDGHPLAGQLHELEGRDVRGLGVRIVHPTDNDVRACDVVFVTAADAATLQALQRATAARPMLTISDRAGFIDRGGMIEMKLINGRTRFDINLAAARAAGLTLSSQLLQLAARVVQ